MVKKRAESKRKLNNQEKVFLSAYMVNFRPVEAAKKAGYADSVATTKAWEWVSQTKCPPNKIHLRDAINDEIERVYGEESIDKKWVLRRAKLLVDFSVSNFIKINDDGEAVYDFSNATPDDWWCLEEFSNDKTLRSAAQGEQIPVSKVKFKTASKVAALKLIGDHVDVAAFGEQDPMAEPQIVVQMTAEEYKKARHLALKEDDC